MEASKEEQQRDVVRFLVAAMCPCPGMLSDGIICLHDNACPRTANPVGYKLQRFGWETLQHPLYSPDLSPGDFHIFGDLKKDIRGRWFHSDEEVQEWVKLWIQQRPTSFYKMELIVWSPSGINVLTLLAITFE